MKLTIHYHYLPTTQKLKNNKLMQTFDSRVILVEALEVMIRIKPQ